MPHAIADIDFGIQLAHAPCETVQAIAESPLTFGFRPHSISCVDVDASSGDLLVATVSHPQWRAGCTVRVHAHLEAGRPARLEAGVVAIANDDLDSDRDRTSLLWKIIDSDPAARPFRREVTERDWRSAREGTLGKHGEMVGYVIAMFAHQVAFRSAAERLYPQAAPAYPLLTYEGTMNSAQVFFGLYGYAAMHRLGPWLVSVDYIHVISEQHHNRGHELYASRAYSYLLSDASEKSLQLSQKLRVSPAALLEEPPSEQREADTRGSRSMVLPQGFAIQREPYPMFIESVLLSELERISGK